MHRVLRPFWITLVTEGIIMDARIPMIAQTTKTSVRVYPAQRWKGFEGRMPTKEHNPGRNTNRCLLVRKFRIPPAEPAGLRSVP